MFGLIATNLDANVDVMATRLFLALYSSLGMACPHLATGGSACSWQALCAYQET